MHARWILGTLALACGVMAAMGCGDDAEPEPGTGTGTTTSTTTGTTGCSDDCPAYAQQGSGRYCEGDLLYVATYACSQDCCDCQGEQLQDCGTAGCVDNEDGDAFCATGQGGAGGTGGTGGTAGSGNAGGFDSGSGGGG